MNYKKKGTQTIIFSEPIKISSAASVTGPKEGKGPVAKEFDVVLSDEYAGADSWEKAESLIVEKTIKIVCEKASLTKDKIDFALAGDLLNQEIGSAFGYRESEIPFIGLFGACSTFGEAIGLGSCLVDGRFAENIIASASSHFCAAERQFRFPLELGSQRPPTSTWTVTGAGAVVLSKNTKGSGAFVTGATFGKIIDLGVKDANNMGAAMAPAAADTVLAFLRDTKTDPQTFDKIITGDLGYLGGELFLDILSKEGINISNYTDCGIEIFDKKTQDTHCGGSGCGCSATVFCARFYPKLVSGEIEKVLFVPTGALMSATSSQQGETIPSIAHLVVVEHRR
ncbi:MAG: stage V sporulation protein AD [Clostridiales bacterium]|jgi:stage V sporulation protein AD|nr:stage V sporulation protein AD [Clostridiales bacterium]